MKAVIFLIVSIGLISYSQCEDKQVINTVETQTVSTSNPSETYQKLCADCHGAKVEAFADRKWKKGNSLTDLNKVISEGLINQGMPAYSNALTSEEIQALSAYIIEAINTRKSYSEETRPTPKSYVTQYHTVEVDTVLEGIKIPWGIEVDIDGTMYVNDKYGKLYQVSNGIKTEIDGVPKVNSSGQGGLLDILLDPGFATNKTLYLSYSKTNGIGSYTTAVCKAVLEGSSLTTVQDIFIAKPWVSTFYHYGSRMLIQDNYLYLTVGDRGKRDDHPQYLDNDCGKTHRIYLDGSIPDDNPFKDEEGKPTSIWSYGHRNLQGLVMTADGTLYNHEHGPKGGDEINKVEKGNNYGWPVISYGINYNGTVFTNKTEQEGMKQPITYWVPSIAPCGMAIVEGQKYPEWSGDILTGSLRFDYVSRCRINDDQLIEKERILEGIGRVRDIEMGRDGFLYIGVEEPGRVLKIRLVE